MAWLLLAILPPAPDVVQERCDLVEVNHFYDDKGRLVYDQVIFYDWWPERSRHMIRAWRLVKSPAILPRYDWRHGCWRSFWHDGEILRDVRADCYRETWTQYDSELAERDFLPKEQRRELAKPRLTPGDARPQ